MLRGVSFAPHSEILCKVEKSDESTDQAHLLCFRKAEPVRQIRPVEIDDPGCSYNPDREQHEATVAHAVAVEVQKNIDADMRAKEPQKQAGWEPETDPLLEYQVSVILTRRGVDNCVLWRLLATNVLPWSVEFLFLFEQVEEVDGDSEEEHSGQEEGSVPSRRPNKKTRTVRNKEARVKEQEVEMAAKQRLKQQRRELQNLDSIGQEISEAEQERERRQQRRERMKAEKALIAPPRLGKVKFQEAPVQVRSQLLQPSPGTLCPPADRLCIALKACVWLVHGACGGVRLGPPHLRDKWQPAQVETRSDAGA